MSSPSIQVVTKNEKPLTHSKSKEQAQLALAANEEKKIETANINNKELTEKSTV